MSTAIDNEADWLRFKHSISVNGIQELSQKFTLMRQAPSAPKNMYNDTQLRSCVGDLLHVLEKRFNEQGKLVLEDLQNLDMTYFAPLVPDGLSEEYKSPLSLITVEIFLRDKFKAALGLAREGRAIE